MGSLFKCLLVDFGGPRGGGRSVKMASKIASKTALALKLGLSTPGSPPGAHFDPLGPRFWSLRELIFEASAASSAAWPEARSPRSAWLTNGGRRCWRSHSQSADHRLRWNERVKRFSLALAWPKSARIGSYGPRQHRRPPFGEVLPRWSKWPFGIQNRLKIALVFNVVFKRSLRPF